MASSETALPFYLTSQNVKDAPKGTRSTLQKAVYDPNPSSSPVCHDLVSYTVYWTLGQFLLKFWWDCFLVRLLTLRLFLRASYSSVGLCVSASVRLLFFLLFLVVINKRFTVDMCVILAPTAKTRECDSSENRTYVSRSVHRATYEITNKVLKSSCKATYLMTIPKKPHTFGQSLIITN
jgi:hypothetical protein